MPNSTLPYDAATELAVLQTLTELKTHYRDFVWESQLWAQVGHRRSPYRVMVLFGLSARTKDNFLVETCRRFFHHFPNASSLLEHRSGRETLLQSIVRKGQLPFVESLSEKLEEWGGKLPPDKASLLQVVGVGEKIADCVLAYGWGKEALPMDGNGCRMYQRLMGLPDMSKSWNSSSIRDNLKTIFIRHRAWMDCQNIAMIDIHELLRIHSQLVCGRSPDCQRCMVTKCLSRRREYSGCMPPESSSGLWKEWRELIVEPEQSG
ncbi:MAG: hypothetical protein BZY81_08775 [SAR202 cluster bacterium Io17-Chloro-G4]|nr:MAG: hypothetical protein BZY81_08775 [SAR202 cluster bacterium Io17-Chloro-G4]